MDEYSYMTSHKVIIQASKFDAVNQQKFVVNTVNISGNFWMSMLKKKITNRASSQALQIEFLWQLPVLALPEQTRV